MSDDYKITIINKAAKDVYAQGATSGSAPAALLNPRAPQPGGGPGRSPLSMLGGFQPTAPISAVRTNPNRLGPGYFSGGWPIPLMTEGMMFSEQGVSGLRQYGGWVREEFLPQLVGRQAARTYREMMDNSAVIGALMFAIVSTMRKVEWRVEPSDDSPDAAELADFLESCMDDMTHTWEDFIVEMLSMLGYGFSFHEIVYKRRLGREPPKAQTAAEATFLGDLPKSKFNDGRIGWRRLPTRGQDTVIKWFFGINGEVLGVTQQPWIGPILDIPMEKGLLFRPTAHKNNPEGRSILRTAYRSWYLTKRLEEQEAILFERIAGLPIVRIPSQVFEDAANGDPVALTKLASFKQIATNLRIDEQMGVVMPSDMWPGDNGPSAQPMYHLELHTPQARTAGLDSDKSITRYNINMMTSVLADFLQLGHESRGTQSLALAKTDMFFQAVEGFLNSGAEVINRYGVERLACLNGDDPDKAGRLVPDMAQRLDLDMLSNFILRMSQSGMPMFPDEDLEQWVRDQVGMPDTSGDGADAILRDAAIEELDQKARQTAARTDSMENQPEPAPGDPKSPTQKRYAMVKGAIIRRLLRMNGAVGDTRPRDLRRKARGLSAAQGARKYRAKTKRAPGAIQLGMAL